VPEYNKYINRINYILKVFKINGVIGILKEIVSFKNLPAGNYVFKVKAKYANSNLDSSCSLFFYYFKAMVFY
jgi:hypothetical protein